MSEKAIRHMLGKVVDAVDQVAREVISVRKAVEKVVDTLREGFDDLLDAIHENTRVQAELKLMEYMTDVHSILPQIAAEREQIAAEKRELDERLVSIGDRYERKHRELDETAAERIRDLGEHIFRIDEEEFEAGVEKPFTDHVSTAWAELREHNQQVRTDRSSAVRNALEAATAEIDQFVERRERLLSGIDDLRADSLAAIDEPTTLEVPFWVVTVERDGVKERVVVAPSQLSSVEDDWIGARLRPLAGLDEPTERIGRTPPSEATARTATGTELQRAIGEYGSERLFGQLSYAEAYGETIPERVPIQVERGGGA